PAALFAAAFVLGELGMLYTPRTAKMAMWYWGFCCFAPFMATGRFIQLVLRDACADYFRVRPNIFRSPRGFWPWLLVILVLGLIVGKARLPLKIAFSLSHPGLDR